MTRAERRALLGDEAFTTAEQLAVDAPEFSEDTRAALAILLRREPASTAA